jgi:GNAT superfamily N-acetyltransferase
METQQAFNDEDQSAIVQLFEEIAAAEGWQPGDQLRAHIARSTYFGIWDKERLAGGLQLVSPDEAGELPSHLVWPELPVVERGTPVLHAAVLAVLPEYRGHDGGAAFWGLGSALWRYCIQQEVKAIWLEATPKMLRCYRLLGWPLEVIGELRTHWGEPVYPCKLEMRAVAGSLAERALTSTTYRGIIDTMLTPSPKAPPIRFLDARIAARQNRGMKICSLPLS